MLYNEISGLIICLEDVNNMLLLEIIDNSRVYPMSTKIKEGGVLSILCESFSDPKWFHRNIDDESYDVTASSIQFDNITYLLQISKIDEKRSGVYECIGYTSAMQKFYAASKVGVIGEHHLYHS